jgi:hypothetical protein
MVRATAGGGDGGLRLSSRRAKAAQLLGREAERCDDERED